MKHTCSRGVWGHGGILLLLSDLCTLNVMQGEHSEEAGDQHSQTRHGVMPYAVPNPEDPTYSHFNEVRWGNLMFVSQYRFACMYITN